MLSQTHRSTTNTTVSYSPLRRHGHEMDGAAFEMKKKTGGDEFEEEFESFLVDELLDFPEANEFETDAVGCDNAGGGGIQSLPTDSVKFDGVVTGSGLGYAPSEISVPADDVAELEWLSRFVDDSFTEYSLTYTGVNLRNSGNVTPATANGGRLFPQPLKKPRGKRNRSAGKSWSSSTSDTTSSSSSSGSTSTLTSSSKRQKRMLNGGVRRCSHCGVHKTPQWRAGPEGAKTLCNACGVRFKSGRLCPEYRPACSPSFCSELHSNKHRKVVEMRRIKEVGKAAESTGTAVSWLAQVV